MFGRQRARKAKFVEARPSLFGRLFGKSSVTGRGGVFRWLLLPWIVITAPLRMLFHVLSLLFLGGRHVSAELRSRHWRHLLEGMPAVFATIGVLGIGAFVLGNQNDLPGIYHEAAHEAFSKEDYVKARLYFERLFELDDGSAETRYQLGIALDKLGRDEEALQLISGVARGDAGGDARANAWVASRLLANVRLRNDPEVRATIYRNLLKAEAGLPRSLQVKLNLANFHLLTGNYRRAIPYLEQAAVLKPVVNIDLAQFYAMDGKKNLARTALERAEKYLRRKLDDKPTNHVTRLLLAKSISMQGRLPEALAILKEGLILDPGGPYSEMMADIHVRMYDQLSAQPKPDHRKMLQHLRDALRLQPGRSGAIRRLVNFGEKTKISAAETASEADDSTASDAAAPSDSAVSDPEVAASAKEMLRRMLVRGENMATVHMALGLKGYRDGDFKMARMHFESAYNLEPTSARIANNLAWILTHQGDPQLERALKVINTVLERFPGKARFRDTRGEVYLAMERWEDAKQEFEAALPQLANDPRIHRSLAKAYAELGFQSLATDHRDAAAQLAEQSTSPE